MYSYFCVFSCVLVSSVITLPTPRPRSLDYKYNPKTNAYYKLHLDPKHISEAEAICKAEGAQLMIPTSENDIRQVFELVIKHRIGSSVWIGKEDKNKECHVITRDMDISAVECIGELPFACKVTAADFNHDRECKDQGYRYYPETGSCYRVPPYATSWHKALIDCQKENAHLLVLNSDREATTIKEFLKNVRRVPDAVNDLYFYAGFRAEKPSRDFYTIFGKSLEENGYVGWSEYEPNNWLGIEYCGSVVRETGMNNDVVCDWDFGFICEKELSTPKVRIDSLNKANISKRNALVTAKPSDEVATKDLESNEVILKVATPDSDIKMAIQAAEINDLRFKMAIQAAEINKMALEATEKSEFSHKMATHASETNDLSPKVTRQAAKKNDLSPKVPIHASETNDLSPKVATQASETIDFIPKLATQASDTNDLIPKLATEVAEINDPSLMMTTYTSETNNLIRKMKTQTTEINNLSPKMATQALEKMTSFFRW